MRSRAQLFSLYARREAAEGARLGRTLAASLADEAEAWSMSDRLLRLMTDIAPQRGRMVAAGLRDAGLLAASLAAEAARQQARAGAVRPEIDRLRALIGRHDRRRQFGDSAATAARIADAEVIEAREDAARPIRRLRG